MGLDDTHPRIQAVVDELASKLTMAQRFWLASELTDFVCDQSMAAIAEVMPGASATEVGLRWCEVHYGNELAARLRRHLAERAR
ncbi:MAG: hypothetical protein ABL997_08920 [Planctomycetota bacterium]